MKRLVSPIKIIFILMAIVISITTIQAQNSKADKKAAKRTAIKNMVDSQRYVFYANTAMPMSGRTVQLTSSYDFKVTKDTVNSYLPYYGRAYTADIGRTQSPLEFILTKFDYDVKEGKSGGWTVTIKPKESDIQSVYISISEDGYATLQVTPTSRQGISFYGYIDAPKPRKK